MEHMETLQNFFCQNERLRNAAETDYEAPKHPISGGTTSQEYHMIYT